MGCAGHRSASRAPPDEAPLKKRDHSEKRYADQIEKITICPLDLPVPFGVAPLAGIGEGKTTGFIRFDAVRDYPLPFAAHGFYDLASQKPSEGE